MVYDLQSAREDEYTKFSILLRKTVKRKFKHFYKIGKAHLNARA